jgi:glycosyltransferase involved in cell wall biosynthesis
MLISIVVPTYNRAGFILKTINSLLNQQNNNFEIIVVDDGSTDDTSDVMRNVTDPRVQYHKKSNAERAAARNYGARLARGSYINFFDSDDIAYPNHIEDAMQAIRNLSTPEVFHLGYDVKDANGNLIREAAVWPATINGRLINGNHLSCNGVFIRQDIVAAFPFNETRKLSASEDYELWLRLAARFPFHCVNTITSTVVNHEFRSVVRINKENLVSRIQILEEELQKDRSFIEVYGSQFSVFKAYLNIYMALHLAMAGYPKAISLRYLQTAILLRPQVLASYRFMAALKNILI